MSAPWLVALVALWVFGSTMPAAAQVVISEIMASNSRTFADEDQEQSDWIELYNSGSQTVDLGGWYLTDDVTDTKKWQFPPVELRPNRYLLVFASGKDRRLPGSQLHTNFRLAASGEYLGLIRPDGVTVEFAWNPNYAPQLADVSYGLSMEDESLVLIPADATGKFLVPPDGVLETFWTELEWPDDNWTEAILGVGFADADAPSVPVAIADSSEEFSGVQGQDQWHYGYYDRTADLTPGYQPEDFQPFPRSPGAHSATNFWDGTSWDWFNGDPPWTELGQRLMHPNGNNSGAEHWAVRRWISPVRGTVTVRWQVAKQSAAGSGVTGRLFHEGTEIDKAVIGGRDLIGITRDFVVDGVEIGDRIDLALSPQGTLNTSGDTGDRSYLSAQVIAANGLATQIRTPIGAAMRGINASAYVRIPFVADSPGQFSFLTLRMKYDDGFVAYLNGVEVARRNAPELPLWNSAATSERPVTETVQVETIDLTDGVGLIHAGTNLLAIHALNVRVDDPDLFLEPELIAVSARVDLSRGRYFVSATPGLPNAAERLNLGPLVVDVNHTPRLPDDDTPVIVTARAVETTDAVAHLRLRYRVMYKTETILPMHDDGAHGDGAANDGVYGAIIPAAASGPGEMVRYAIVATDADGDSSRWPPYADPRNSPEYYGTMISDPNVSTVLPVLYWFIQNPRAADSESGTRASVFFDGVLYDNIGVNLHGQSSASFPKKSYDFDFHRGHHFRYSPDERPVEDFNLLTTYPDKSHMRNLLAYETYRNAGSTYHVAFPIRVQQNGAFYSHAHWVEDGDEDFLARLGLDPDGALYKMYNSLDSSTSGVEKKTRKHERNADLQAMLIGAGRSGAARTQFIFDHVDVPAMVNYLAAMIITGGIDCCHKNYYAYRDTNGTGEWQYLPWDVDLTFGRNWNSANTYYDDTMFASNPLFVGNNNRLIAALYATPAVRQMYLRRVRTLMDELLQPANTPSSELKFEKRIRELSELIGPDAALDFQKWPTWGRKQTLQQAVAILTNQYLPARRRFLYGQSQLPPPQPGNATLAVKSIDFFPASRNQDEEFIEIGNPGAVPLDISGWRLAGAVSHTFRPGTVLPTNSSIYLSPNVNAFRARKTSPKGGQGLFVQGNYQGRLSARGETVRVLDVLGREAAVLTYEGEPTATQQGLRITEIMYHPDGPPAGSPFATEQFEFLQLKNIGSVALELNGVRLTDGIQFAFSGSMLLMPGEVVYLAKNPEAFVSRYGRGFHVAGPYDGQLDNGGETLRLEDPSGEKVLEFEYNDSWHTVTDGTGFSLLVADATAAWDRWSERLHWKASAKAGGTPASEPSPLARWTADHFSEVELADAAVSGENADPDRDGRSNYQEFVSGTDPRDPTSVLQLQVQGLAPLSNGVFSIQFEAVPGRSYSVQYSESATPARWIKLTDVPAQHVKRTVELSDGIGDGSSTRFYRVVTPQQP